MEAEVCPFHLHMLPENQLKLSVSGVKGYLKEKCSTMHYEQFGKLKYRYQGREFWYCVCYVDTPVRGESRIAEYVRNQLKEDEKLT